MKYIKQKGMPDEIAWEAYENGYYIEAIQILHNWIENQAQSYLMLIGIHHFEANQSDTWDLTDTLNFSTVIKCLFILNQITRKQYDDLSALNSIRNKIIHQIYKEPYDKEYKGVSVHEYEKIFKNTISQAYLFTDMNAELVG